MKAWSGLFHLCGLMLCGLVFGVATAAAENKLLEELRQRAEQGHADAQTGLGAMYATGQSVPQDDAEAVKWYRKAAKQGYAYAQFLLGNMYQNGQGVSQNFTEAVKWHRKAAERGIPEAQYMLGLKYAVGQGVPQDNVQAYAWLNIVAARGSAEAEGNKQLIAERMTRAEVAAAQKLAREYWEAYVVPFRK